MNTISDLGVLTSIDYNDRGDDIGNDGHVCNTVSGRYYQERLDPSPSSLELPISFQLFELGPLVDEEDDDDDDDDEVYNDDDDVDLNSP